MSLQQDTLQHTMNDEKPAGFWIRLLAQILDGILISLPIAIILLFLDVPGTEEIFLPNGTIVEEKLQAYMLYNGIANLIVTLYMILLPVIWNGYTLGKRIVGIHIVKDNGEKVTLGNMILRVIIGGIVEFFALCGFISLLMVIFRKDKRTLHDLVAGTAVRYVNK